MCGEATDILKDLGNLCGLAGYEYLGFLRTVRRLLKEDIKKLLTPNEEWFGEGKSLKKYWLFVEEITQHKWDYEDVLYWYNLIRNPSETREDITPALRYEVLTRDEFTCQTCGRKPPDVELEVDHVVPWALGGPTVLGNLRTLCAKCNAGKSDISFT